MDVENVSYRFLQHLIVLIKENVNDMTPISKAPNEFEAGRSMGYYEISDFVLECCRIFNVELSELGISDFDPDRLL